MKRLMPAWRAWRVWACGFTLAAARLGSTGPALAQAPSPTAERGFALEYRAAPECPDSLALVSAIQSRTPGAELVDPVAAAVRLKVELQPAGQSSLWVELAEGGLRRDVPSTSCGEALASFAVIVSMVLEAEPASRRAMAESAPPESAPTAAAEVARDEAPPSDATAAAEPAKAPPVPPAPPRDVGGSRSARERSVGVAVSGGLGLESAVAPATPLGGACDLELWARPEHVLAPGSQVGLVITGTSTNPSPSGTAYFSLVTARFRGCVLRAALSENARLIPCLAFEVGSLSARGGGDAENPEQKSMPWLTAGAVLRAQLDLAEGVLALEGSGSLKRLLRHDRFTFRPTSLAFEVPSYSIGAELGLSVRLH
jgi:hypothetical protein